MATMLDQEVRGLIFLNMLPPWPASALPVRVFCCLTLRFTVPLSFCRKLKLMVTPYGAEQMNVMPRENRYIGLKD